MIKMAFVPALAAAFGPLALQALKSNAPAIASLGQGAFALGKPGFKRLLSTIGKQLQTPEGRAAVLGQAGRAYSTISQASREGASLLNRAGIIRNSRLQKINQGLGSFDAQAQNAMGLLSKVNKRLR